MAFDKGVVTIKEIELDHGIWKVQGRDASGHKIEIEADAGKRRDREDQAPLTTDAAGKPRRASAAQVYPHAVTALTMNLFFAAIAAYIESAGASRIWR